MISVFIPGYLVTRIILDCKMTYHVCFSGLLSGSSIKILKSARLLTFLINVFLFILNTALGFRGPRMLSILVMS